MDATPTNQEPEKKPKKSLKLDDVNLQTNQIVFSQTGNEGKTLSVFVNEEPFGETQIIDPVVIVTSTEKTIPPSHTITFQII